MSKYVIDMESFYDSKQGYTLRKMTTEEYINDPRFHCFGFSILRDGGQPLWVPEEKVDFMLRQLKLHEHAVIMHNAPFDAAILNWKYGVRPKLIIDTLAMARGVLGNTERLSLEALGERYGVGVKGDTVLHMDGVRYPSPAMVRKLGEYAKNDAAMTWGLWENLSPGFPAVEMFTIDITTRMFTEPSVMMDKRPILRELQLDSERRETLLTQANCTLGDLRSDAKFAELLSNLGVVPPKKLSAKKTAAAKKKDPDAQPVYAWAFAKSDPDFKHLAESEDDLVRWVCEARLGLKSTIKQSRAQRFLSIAERVGKLPVALDYYGAATGRYAASSSGKINCQNLPAVRGSKDPDVGLLRKSMVAPKGKMVFVVDASQIEARFVAWLAGQEDLVEAFAQGRDVYSEMASKIYRRHVDGKKNPDDYIARFLGKAVTLGCLGPETKVLTRDGWKDIVCVKATDMLWDGEEWIRHSGVIPKGIKEVETAFGLTATMDHEILTEHGWVEWSEVHMSNSHFQSALSLASLPSSSGSTRKTKTGGRVGGILSCAARAVWNTWCTGKTFAKGSLRDATSVLKKPRSIPEKDTGGMQKFFQTMSTGNGCSIALRQSLADAKRDKNGRTRSTMHCAVSACIPSGQTGYLGEGTSSNTFSRLSGGITQSLKLIESTTKVIMSRETCGSLGGARTWLTADTSESCKSRLMTYDVVLAGPRNRFTVATNAGPIIVHNCGYSMGFFKFGQTVYGGMLGGPSILFDRAFADALDVDVERFAKFIRGKEDMLERVAETKPVKQTAEEWVTHLACARKIITTYRESNPMIPELWAKCGRMIAAMHEGVEMHVGPVYTEKNAIVLPNGMKLLYKELERNDEGEYSYLRKKEGRVQRAKIYGGALLENLSQSLAGVYIKEAMVRMHLRGLRPVLQVHDEVVVIADEKNADETLSVMNECMTIVPDWAQGLPLAAEGDYAVSYGDAR